VAPSREEAKTKILEAPTTANVTTSESGNMHTASSAEYVVGEIKNHKLGFAVGSIVLLAILGFGYWFLAKSPDNSNTSLNVPAAAPAPKSKSKLYWQMTETVQLAFILERARHIQTLIGDEPTEFNEEELRAIKVEIDDYVEEKDSLSQKPFEEGLRVIYGRASQYAPLVIRAYEARRVPPALGIYQAMIESEYHDCLISETGPVGLFQFSRKTAAKYGLKPKDYCDVEKQSDAAARYMSDLSSDFGDGKSSATLGLLGFMIGEDKPREYLRQLRGRGVTERSFWAIFRYQQNLQPPLSSDGKLYVPRFFAVAIIGETPEVFELFTLPLSTLREIGK
ncbi:MAG: transglycosylase SLT domain-containing protein, partial [Acidobacteriota bacterium]|nr:transglycosylase SLT domain-containing protein [Acidobacteriota bacterium]